MHRILAEKGEAGDRRAQRSHPPRPVPQLVATAPCEVWSWDITRLAGPTRWSSYALYVVLDIYSRYVVGWMVAERELAKLAKRLLETCIERNSPLTFQVGEYALRFHRAAIEKNSKDRDS